LPYLVILSVSARFAVIPLCANYRGMQDPSMNFSEEGGSGSSSGKIHTLNQQRRANYCGGLTHRFS
jgi:hypothetical protein